MTYKVILEWDIASEVWVTYVLGGISTFGKTEQEAIAMTRDMILGYLEAFGGEPPQASARSPA